MRTDAVPATRERVMPAPLLRLASDQRLAAQVRAGSERAFEVLFDRHHRPIVAFCRHMLGSTEEAEDAAQLTFLAAYRDLVRAEPPFALRPWLYAIARHRCLSVLRTRRERPVEEVPEPRLVHVAADTATREDLRTILADVARLPDDQRAALVLAELGDVSHEDIAQVLDCQRTKVKALVFQARTSLAASRDARETPCAEIREQLATLHGGALRRSILHRHLHECAGCRAFRKELRSRRRALALLLPVHPALGLRRAVLGALFGSGGGAGGAALTAGALSAGGLAAIGLAALAIPAGGVSPAATTGGRAPLASARAVHAAAPPHARGERAHAEPARHVRASVVRTERIAVTHAPVRQQAEADRPATGNSGAPPRPHEATSTRAREPEAAPEAPRAGEAAAPATPAKRPAPPRANGRPAPAKPLKPPHPDRHAAPAARVTPPQAAAHGAAPERAVPGPPPAPPASHAAGRQPSAEPPSPPAAAATPGDPPSGAHGNGHEPAGG
jgi:RNA polymerase sigma factor (sigma-70 family)